MDIHAYVTLVGEYRLTGVHADPYSDAAALKRLLRLCRSCQRIGGTGEGNEERVALSVDLDTVMAGERLPQHDSMLGQRIGVRGAELMEKPRRTLDVGEQERDGPGW